MPLPSPKKNQDKDDFISNCMNDPKMKEEFSNNKRRLAVCFSQQKRRNAKGAEHMDWIDWDYEENYYYIMW
jgi:hypothetical protein